MTYIVTPAKLIFREGATIPTTHFLPQSSLSLTENRPTPFLQFTQSEIQDIQVLLRALNFALHFLDFRIGARRTGPFFVSMVIPAQASVIVVAVTSALQERRTPERWLKSVRVLGARRKVR